MDRSFSCMIILPYWELGHVDGFISGRFWMDSGMRPTLLQLGG